MAPIVGIDLGTTNSVIAVLDSTDSALTTGQDEQGRKTVPSVVGCLPDSGRPVVGRVALLHQLPRGPVDAGDVQRVLRAELFLEPPQLHADGRLGAAERLGRECEALQIGDHHEDPHGIDIEGGGHSIYSDLSFLK